MISTGLLMVTLTASIVALSLSILILVAIRMSLISWLPKDCSGQISDGMLVSIILGALVLMTGIVSMATAVRGLPVASFILFVAQLVALLWPLARLLWTPKAE